MRTRSTMALVGPTSLNEELYQHVPLRKDTSIRLLTLLPGDYGTPLCCRIAECEYPQETLYEALSYTWNNPVFPEVIYDCDILDPDRRQYIPVTQNLYNALQCLRKADAPRNLWIDALCINQTDLQEKGYQVARMDKTYLGADCVVVWLGHNNDFPRTSKYFDYRMSGTFRSHVKVIYGGPWKGPFGSYLGEGEETPLEKIYEEFLTISWYAYCILQSQSVAHTTDMIQVPPSVDSARVCTC